MTTQAERIARLEIEVSLMKDDVREMNKKLDELLALRNKGAGVFWLASAIFGTTVIGVLSAVANWFK